MKWCNYTFLSATFLMLGLLSLILSSDDPISACLVRLCIVGWIVATRIHDIVSSACTATWHSVWDTCMRPAPCCFKFSFNFLDFKTKDSSSARGWRVSSINQFDTGADTPYHISIIVVHVRLIENTVLSVSSRTSWTIVRISDSVAKNQPAADTKLLHSHAHIPKSQRTW